MGLLGVTGFVGSMLWNIKTPPGRSGITAPPWGGR